MVVPGAAVAGVIEALAGRSEWQDLFALGQRFKQVILRFVGGALGAVDAPKHAGELALGHIFQRAAHVQTAVNRAVGFAKHSA
ncbi:hypothetical protein D3C86_1355440 [compost metagenome]